ncbi:MAG: SPOR domain-containing protein [Trueperaceae bacterium]
MRDLSAISLFLVLLLFGSLAVGQGWTVQTAAFQDFRQASGQVGELRELGFDAYTEFVMEEGQQFSRVRIGCFSSRQAAAAYARVLRGNVTAEAVAQPLSQGADTQACVTTVTGFVKPRLWSVQRTGTDIVFRVELGGQVGFLRHQGVAWQFTHSLPAQREATPAGQARFREVEMGGLTLIQARLSDGSPVNACHGRLLWQRGLTSVVERTNTVVACLVEETASGEVP